MGGTPVYQDFKYIKMIDIAPYDNPTTTPASIIFLHGDDKRFTTPTMTATPIVTHHEVIFRFFVAWTNPIEYSGARM